MIYELLLDKKAKKDLEKLEKNKKLFTKALEMLEEITLDPYSPAHKFERLRGNYSGFFSKRLDQKNRVIYQVFENQIIVSVVSILGHYED